MLQSCRFNPISAEINRPAVSGCVPVQVGRVWTAPSRAPAVPGDRAAIRRVSVPTGRPATRSTGPAPARRAGGRNTATYRVL